MVIKLPLAIAKAALRVGAVPCSRLSRLHVSFLLHVTVTLGP